MVGERGVDVAVADDVGAALERGPDDALDELGARGRKQRSLGPGRQLVTVEQELADALAEVRPARLARADDLSTLRLEGLAQELGLRRLARAVQAFEGHEHQPLKAPTRRRRPSGRAGSARASV